jgi:tRNA(adenine34) deaminase
MSTLHENWMKLALKEAARAYDLNEVPVGALIVHQNTIIAKGFNQMEKLQDPTAHAEMIAITAAASHQQSRRLTGCTMYVTLEPCPMCAGAIVMARIPTLVFGAFDPKAGACGTLFNIVDEKRLNHRPHVISGVLDAECEAILKDFFKEKRKK